MSPDAGPPPDTKTDPELNFLVFIIGDAREAALPIPENCTPDNVSNTLARFATSKYDSSLLGGLTAANYSKQTSGIVSKANAAQGAAAAASSGGPFQNLVINVSADNSVIPDQFGKNLAAQIQSAVQKAYAKTHTSNNVGNNTTTRGVKVK